jgi:hypothetical protein
MTGKENLWKPGVALILIVFITIAATVLPSGSHAAKQKHEKDRKILADVEGLVWHGDDSLLTFEKLAALCAPILWFSPDEPLLDGNKWDKIRIPIAFPFEEPVDTPVVYYRIRRVLVREGAEWYGLEIDPNDPGKTELDISKLVGMDLDFFFYYPTEEGFGGHDHDVESVEMKVLFGSRDHFQEGVYAMAVWKIVAKAHGILWYDNTLEVDEYTRFPITILVEEGKHASCTDKNGDGYYTRGYDVNRRINDAWGVRDIIRSGGLGTGGFETWMAKVRNDGDAVFPPLPGDSPHREQFVEDSVYAPDYAKYELRPFPTSEKAADDLKPFIDSKGYPDWPESEKFDDLKQFSSWFVDESFMKSIAVAYRYDGDNGIVFNFPLFIVKNFEEPMSGGWIVNRVYFKDYKLRDFGYNLLYTTSASRWVDGYFAAGFEIDAYDTAEGQKRETLFVSETGIKFRANLKHSPLKFITVLGTDFWGLRIGMKYTGAWDFSRMGYVVEIGAGVW